MFTKITDEAILNELRPAGKLIKKIKLKYFLLILFISIKNIK